MARITLPIVLCVAIAFVICTMLLYACTAHAGAYGRAVGESNPPEIRAWYQHVLRPDTLPALYPCCGEADAYYADGVEVVDGQVYAIITDERPDCIASPDRYGGEVCRTHEEIGTRYLIPPEKVVGKQAGGNPTGHIIVFLSYTNMSGTERTRPRDVLCYVQNGGV